MKLLPAIILIFLVEVLSCRCQAQPVFSSAPRFQAMADASCALSGNWSVFGNQAGLASVSRLETAVSFQNRFLISELSSGNGLFVFPVQSNIFAVSYSQFGKVPFRQEKIGLAYARSVGSKLRFGVQFNRYGLYIPEENSTATDYGLEIGTQFLVSGNLIVALHVVNPYPVRINFSAETYRYDSKISVGGLYQVSEDFGWALELENDFESRLILKSGFEYDILKRLVVRAGFAGKPYRLSAGFGFRVRKMMFDFATTYNQYLGNSPSVSFQYQF